MTTDLALDSFFRTSLAEAIAWARDAAVGDLVNHLWSGNLARPSVKHELLTASHAERDFIVKDVVRSRSALLHSSFYEIPDMPPVVSGSSLLLYAPDDSLTDGAASLEAMGFFDEINAPAWGTWMPYHFTSCVVCWIPPSLTELVDTGVRANPEGCIAWASDYADIALFLDRLLHLSASMTQPG